MYKAGRIIAVILVGWMGLLPLGRAWGGKYSPASLAKVVEQRENIRVWIYLVKDEQTTRFWEERPVSDRVRLRLRRTDPRQRPVDGEFYPSAALVRLLSDKGVVLRYYSRILQAYSAVVDRRALEQLQGLPFVERIEPVAILQREKSSPLLSELQKLAALGTSQRYYSQIAQLNIPKVHQRQITGKGVRIGVIDTGFNLEHEVLQRTLSQNRLIAQYDFINQDGEVADEDPTDVTFTGRQSTHGTAVWGLIAGYMAGKYVGAAYDAEFVLAKTEIISSETRVEEDNFLAAVEWCDELGVDIISVSLGYRDFDDFSYSYLDLDGKSTKVAKAVNWAFERGILVVSAAGNEAQKYPDGGIISPGDAFGVLTVGAVDSNGIIGVFSSYGTTPDGRIKPDVCARGVLNYLIASANPTGYYVGSGTSFATPLIAGAAALLLQRFPHFTPSELVDQLKRHTNYAQNPQLPYGWGIPDVYQAVIDTLVEEYTGREPAYDQILAYPNPVKSSLRMTLIWEKAQPLSERALLRIVDLRGVVVYEQALPAGYFQRREFLDFDTNTLPNGVYLIYLRSKSYVKKGKFLVLH